MSLNLIFAGTPEFAAEHLQALIDSEHRVVAVYSQPDRPAGRGRKLTASPVKSLALAHQIPVLQPINFKSDAAQTELAALQADLMVVVAYGLILPQVILDTPRLGCVMYMPHSCRVGVVPHQFTVPCWPTMRKRA